MDLTSLLIGAAIGLVLAYILFYLLHKSNSVPKQEYDTLTTKLNDTVSTLKLTEDRLKSQQELAQSFQQKVERKESELSSLLSRTATLEATLNMNGQRLKEMSSTLTEQTETNRTQRLQTMSKLSRALLLINRRNLS